MSKHLRNLKKKLDPRLKHHINALQAMAMRMEYKDLENILKSKPRHLVIVKYKKDIPKEPEADTVYIKDPQFLIDKQCGDMYRLSKLNQGNINVLSHTLMLKRKHETNNTGKVSD